MILFYFYTQSLINPGPSPASVINHNKLTVSVKQTMDSMKQFRYHIYLCVISFICCINSYRNIKTSSLSSSSWLTLTVPKSDAILMNKSMLLFSTISANVIAPPKTDTKKKNDIKIDPIVKDNKSSNIQKLYEEFIEENNEEYAVILYDDPFNKRAYVAAVLMDTFKWSEDMATSGICY